MRRVGLVVASCAFLVTAVGDTAAAASQPLRGATLRIALGVKDRQPSKWDGRIALSPGQITALDAQTPRLAQVQGAAWKAATRHRFPKRKKKGPILRPVLLATVAAPEDAQVTVSTPRGPASFVLASLNVGESQALADGQVRVTRLPLTVQLTSQPTEEDWPAGAAGRDGTVWVAYMVYKQAGPLNAQRIHQQKEFDSLKPTDNGDQVHLAKFDGKAWGEPLAVTEPGLDVWRPAVAVDGTGRVWVLWSQNLEGNWDLYARAYDPAQQQWGETTRLTSAPGSDVCPAAATHPKTGAVHVAWQGWREGSFDILTAALPDGQERAVFSSPANEWCPAAAFDSTGRLHVAFDTYQAGNYDVRLARDVLGDDPEMIAVADTPRYEARPDLAVDARNRLWVAYEVGDANWGKDTGLRWKGRTGHMLYVRRDIALRCLDGDQALEPKGRVPAGEVKAGYPRGSVGAKRRISLPRIGFDGAGRLWLFYRRHPGQAGGGERWASFATSYAGDAWGPAVQVPGSMNVLDNRPALIASGSGPLLAIHSTDYRTGGTRSARQNDLFSTVLGAPGTAESPELVPPKAPEEPPEGAAPVVVHPNETEDVARLRGYRATVDGQAYRLLRGEFHRHTALTAHQDMDGSLEEMWRYALDAAEMDWIGNGDHENGYFVEYLWWLVQKQTDIYHHPPAFTPMYTYERSRRYPSGHRNAMFAQRGIRPLPYHPGGREAIYGTPETGAADIKTLYAYLKHFDGICASHTSATGMGTDWRDWDPGVEPVVEIYQGLRQNYEHADAPGAPSKGDAIGGFQPAGFVWNAWQKGHTLGIQVSSDHYSTHISYAIVYATEPSRQAILDAFKKRHCYGANDNIVLDVRCGDRMMGDIFEMSGKPTLRIKALGTEPIARLSIIRGVGRDVPRYVYDIQPKKQNVELTWTDQEPAPGQRAYYYVRIEQTPPEKGFGALAWASPMWITVTE